MTARLLPVGVFVCLFRETLESDPLYSDLWLEGEISDLSRSAAGHTYFSLRDVDGALKCVLFRGNALRQLRPPRLGDQVAVHGGLSVYPRSGSMQLVVDLVRPAGLGAATLELEYLRQRLESEGLFDIERKRALPEWPRAIAVVTSAHGAAWHDIQTVVARRFPLTSLVLAPALVQGPGAPESIVAALESVQLAPRVDIVILARGGGAADDLAAFNDERVVRAVFASRIPVVTGIGHATDRTLVEEVADLAAPTPSAAAEVSVPAIAELHDRILTLSSRLARSISTHKADSTIQAQSASSRLAARTPRLRVRTLDAALRSREDELGKHLMLRLETERRRVDNAGALLATLDPRAVLRRGYAALVDAESERAVFSTSQVTPGSTVTVVLHDGSLATTVNQIAPAIPADTRA